MAVWARARNDIAAAALQGVVVMMVVVVVECPCPGAKVVTGMVGITTTKRGGKGGEFRKDGV